MPPKQTSGKPRTKLSDDFGKDYTPEETERFAKAFQNEEFKKLFFDYLQEISQPGKLEENERMITEAELLNEKRQAQINTVKQTTFPQPGSAKSATAGLKTQQTSKQNSKQSHTSQPKPKSKPTPAPAQPKQQKEPKGKSKAKAKQPKQEMHPSKTAELPVPEEPQIHSIGTKTQMSPTVYPTIPHYEKIYVQDFNMADHMMVCYSTLIDGCISILGYSIWIVILLSVVYHALLG